MFDLMELPCLDSIIEENNRENICKYIFNWIHFDEIFQGFKKKFLSNYIYYCNFRDLFQFHEILRRVAWLHSFCKAFLQNQFIIICLTFVCKFQVKIWLNVDLTEKMRGAKNVVSFLKDSTPCKTSQSLTTTKKDKKFAYRPKMMKICTSSFTLSTKRVLNPYCCCLRTKLRVVAQRNAGA